MTTKKFFAALAFAAALPAFAANQTITITTSPLTDADNKFHSASAPGDGVLSDGDDTLWFTGLEAGKYNISIGLVGQNLVFDALKTELNGAKGFVVGDSTFSFFGISYKGDAGFTLQLFGTPAQGALYSGNVTVTAVPEPATYSMMGGGLLALAALARRRGKRR